jgi:hypothetical protein
MWWVFVVGIAAFAVYAAVQFYRYRGSGKWPVVEGAIEGAPEMHADGSDGASYSILFYSYAVDGDRYSGEWKSPSKAKKQQIVDVIAAKLPSGAKVEIRYNPKRPAMSMADISPALFDDDAIIRLEL